MLVLLNFSSKPAAFNTGINLSNARLLLRNYDAGLKKGFLLTYEAAVYQLNSN